MSDVKLMELLNALAPVENDSGRRYLSSFRTDAVQKLLWNSRYRRVDTQGLFHMYAQKPLDSIKTPAVLVSSHTDSAAGVPVGRTFTEEDGVISGMPDGAAVNAALLYVMLNSSLPDNVIIAFTGGRHADFTGAAQAAEYLESKNIRTDITAVLDVTSLGVREGADITIENNFWDDEQGGKLIGLIRSLTAKWYFVPADPDEIPAYVYSDRVIKAESAADESWKYDELGGDCFSLKLPVGKGAGRELTVRKKSLTAYAEAVEKILRFW